MFFNNFNGNFSNMFNHVNKFQSFFSKQFNNFNNQHERSGLFLSVTSNCKEDVSLIELEKLALQYWDKGWKCSLVTS